MVGGLEDFLSRFKIDTGRNPTHTRFGDTFGSYYIPVIENERFFRVYAHHLSRKKSTGSSRSIGLVERHRDFGPIVIDLDFRYTPDESSNAREPYRRYKDIHIHSFLNKYLRVLKRWIPLPDDVSDLRIYIMEKPNAKLDKGVVKDGVHIVFPDIVIDTRVQMLIRRDFVELASRCNLKESLGISNTIDNAFDEAVIQRNGWMMYGSGKAGEPAYELTRIFTPKDDYGDYIFVDVPDFTVPVSEEDILSMVQKLSVRNKERNLEVWPERIKQIEDAIRVEEMAKEHRRRNPMLQECEAPKAHATTDDYELAKRLVHLLDQDRADSYMDWMRVGWCLHNIDDRLMTEWIDFSKMSPKYESGLCEILWMYMIRNPDGLGMGSLRMWARHDDPSKYDEIVKICISNRVQAAITGLHHDVAMVVMGMYGNRFVCSSIKLNTWYEYFGHRWNMCDNGYALRKFLSVDVFNRFTDEAANANRRAQSFSMDEDADGRQGNAETAVKHAVISEIFTKLNEIASKLKTCSFKEAVMKECKELFYQNGFESRLDTKPHLLGFQNGVYDLELHEFREGSPEDMISYSAGFNYTTYDDSHPVMQDIVLFFEQIQPREDVRRYLLKLLGSYLNGNIREERFHVWTGSGANGKSLTIDLFERALGDYCCKLPVSLLTQKRAASNAATSEIARLKGRRFACLQEPGNDETLNVGLMKELTGGDRIMARQLYREPIEFRSYARLALICNNLPNVPSTDGGSWRRIRVIDFLSKFCSDPNPDNPNEFPLDTALSSKLDDWAPHMMALLIQYYKLYNTEGNKEPAAVMKVTKDYQQSQDAVQLFINHYLVRDKRGTVSVPDVHAMYKDFLKEMSINGLSTRRLDFVQEMIRHTSCTLSGSGNVERLVGLSMRADKGETQGDTEG